MLVFLMRNFKNAHLIRVFRLALIASFHGWVEGVDAIYSNAIETISLLPRAL
jgi:hypothetical protein